MKKLIAILLVAMLALSAFAACGKNNTTPAATEATNADGTPVETTDNTETTAPTATEADQETEPESNVEVDIDTEEEEDSTEDENAVINFDDLIDAAS